MKNSFLFAFGLLTLTAGAQTFNSTYDINANTDILRPGFVMVNSNNEYISVSSGTDGTSNYYLLTKVDAAGNPVYNNIVRASNAPTDGFTHVEALHETWDGGTLVGGYYYKDISSPVEWPFLAKFDNNGAFLWCSIFPVNQRAIVNPEINKVSICRVHNDTDENYFLVASGDSDREPGVGVATNVIKTDNAGNLIFSHKYYDIAPGSMRRVREYPGDMEFSKQDSIYLITGHRRHENPNGTTSFLMYYFGIDNTGAIVTNFTTLESKSMPIDQDMIYDANTDLFATVFTHERDNYVQGTQSVIGFMTINTGLTVVNSRHIWHQPGFIHNGRSISHTGSGDYMLGAGIYDFAPANINNPALVRVNPAGVPASFVKYNILDTVHFGHHTWSSAVDSFILVNEHKTDLREIKTDANSTACGSRTYTPLSQGDTLQQTFYTYFHRRVDRVLDYTVRDSLFIPNYRQCQNDTSSYRPTGIVHLNMGNKNTLIYPTVLSSRQALVTIGNNSGNRIRIEVRNLTGQLIFSAAQIGTGKQELNLGANGDLAPGLYLINVFDAQEQLSNSTRIVINQ